MPLLEFDARLRYPSGFELDVSFASDAAVTGLFGASGSGKSSVLSIIAGLRRPQSGRICLKGRVLFDGKHDVNLKPERRHVGYVFQDQLLFPHLSVRNNLLYGARRQRSAAGRNGTPIELPRVVDVLELGDLLGRLPGTLSGGERQRVALGRAFLANPELLLLDEPLAFVDEHRRDKVLGFMERALSEWRVPALYVTHDANEMKRMATQVVSLRNGKLAETLHCHQ